MEYSVERDCACQVDGVANGRFCDSAFVQPLGKSIYETAGDDDSDAYRALTEHVNQTCGFEVESD